MSLTTLVSGRTFTEGPRWHAGRLYYSDFYNHAVEAVDMNGRAEIIARVPGQPSGLGWLPDGTMLIVSMTDRKLMHRDIHGQLTVWADLSELASFHCNDMVVDAEGNAYIGNFGWDIEIPDAKPVPANLILVTADRRVSVAYPDMLFPNGAVITPNGKTLIIGETFGRRLTAFDIEEKGKLSNRRIWADVNPHLPDGICLDKEGAIWIADPANNCVVRFLEGGEITDKIDTGRSAFACMLGGEDGKRLFVCTATTSGSEAAKNQDAAIEYIDVRVPGAGLP